MIKDEQVFKTPACLFFFFIHNIDSRHPFLDLGGQGVDTVLSFESDDTFSSPLLQETNKQ